LSQKISQHLQALFSHVKISKKITTFTDGPMPIPSDFLKSIPYLKSLRKQEIERICKKTLELSFDKGQMILLEGDFGRGLYAVKTGKVRIFRTSQGGREQILRIAQGGETFNDVPVFDDGPNPANALALEPSVIYFIPKEELLVNLRLPCGNSNPRIGTEYAI
jgi:signal-transduction protein with cAMP-binding, CBS, and nucleotidyltransferase domain